MDLSNCPMLGTPKQNSFIISLAKGLGWTELRLAVNAALGRNHDAPIPPGSIGVGDAKTIINFLLAQYTAQGKPLPFKGKKKGNGSHPSPSPSPAPEVRTLSQYTSEELANELKFRDGHKLVSFSTEFLCTALEKRGLPGNALLANPDLLGMADLIAFHLGMLATGVLAPGNGCDFKICEQMSNEALKVLEDAGVEVSSWEDGKYGGVETLADLAKSGK